MSMTPERIEEKGTLSHTETVKALRDIAESTDNEISINVDFIRRLSRSAYVHLTTAGSKRAKLRRQLEETERQLSLERERTDYWGEKDLEARNELAEAQQTIATLTNYLKELRDITSNEIIVSQVTNVLNEALGNKEGEKTDESHNNS